jgi:hypothetical protein
MDCQDCQLSASSRTGYKEMGGGKDCPMKKTFAPCLPLIVIFAFSAVSFAQSKPQPSNAGKPTTSSAASDAQDKNIREYIELLRTDVRQQKAEIMGSMMLLGPDQAAKFWPIYSEYDAALKKLNDQRTANTLEYARSYAQMTDAKADELIRKALQYQQQRSDLLARYYDRVKQSIGAIQAARFVQIENQLLMLIDLRIASSLPVVQKGS